MKQAAVCTLFEKQYHFGVAVLVNSLYDQGFRGNVYVGYRGELPFWTQKASENNSLAWPGAQSLMMEEGLNIHFLPLSTTNHLTNHKPDFMLQLWSGPARNATQLFYFDPDIVVNTSWSFLEEWANQSVAVCEDVNSPLPQHHPRRKAWRKYFAKYGIELTYKEMLYANGGFVGVHVENKSFLEKWKLIQEKMAFEIGGLGISQFDSSKTNVKMFSDPNYPFSKTDQDALNASVEAWDGQVSFVGKEGMGFKNGFALLPHAIGTEKPWNRNALKMAVLGMPPKTVDHCYLQYSRGLIKTCSKTTHFRKKMANKLAALIGRFYRRS